MKLRVTGPQLRKVIEQSIFSSRWILVIFYWGLILSQVIYCFKFVGLVLHLMLHFWLLDQEEVMLLVLALVDIVMVANLIKMITSGSYQSYVNKIEADHTEKVGSGLLKVKMGMSLVGISSIHLLSAFLKPEQQTNRDLVVMIGIHLVFVMSTIALSVIDFLHVYSKRFEPEATERIEVRESKTIEDRRVVVSTDGADHTDTD